MSTDVISSSTETAYLPSAMPIMKQIFPLLALLFLTTAFYAAEPWTKAQLMEPAELAANLLNRKATHPLVLCVGPQAVIKGSKDIGPGQEEESLDKLKKEVAGLSKESEIVLYCGCCPFAKCPNIRPAFKELTKMGFKNHKLLNLPTTVKADWMDKGYPVQE
jgi:thiosulfate/3-mercaptopyruvate sulfurtransferase